MLKLNIIAIIPARGGSKGILDKNIIKFCGQPLISWSIRQALKSKYIKSVYVTSNDEKILKVSSRYDAKIIKRPEFLASDRSPTEKALGHALACITKAERIRVDVVVFLQATSPLRTADDIDGAIKTFISSKADSLFSASILDDFCVWEKKGPLLKSLTYDYKHRLRRQDREPYYLENGSIYIFKPEVLRKYNNRLGGNIGLYLMEHWKSYEIDKKEDIGLCSYFMKRCQIKKSQK